MEVRKAVLGDKYSKNGNSSLSYEEDNQRLNIENNNDKESNKESCKIDLYSPPENVEILVNATQECNLNCGYCFVNKGRFNFQERRQKALSPKTAKRLIEVLPNRIPWAKHICVHFYGGEPLLNLSAINAALEAASNNADLFSFAVTTNGTIATDEAISTLTRGKLNIILSIDGPEHIHDTFRRTKKGEPTHSKVLEFIKKARSKNLFIRGSSVVRKGWSLREAHSYLETLAVDAIKAQAVRLPLSNPMVLKGKERIDYFNDLKYIRNLTIKNLQKGKCPKDDRFNGRVLQLLCRRKRESFCGAGKRTFGMSSEGTILPCVLLAGKEEFNLGNIKDKGEWVQKGLLWTEKNKPRKECQECWALPLCGGGCPVMLSVCGEDECEMVRENCENALVIYASFLERTEDLLLLAGV